MDIFHNLQGAIQNLPVSINCQLGDAFQPSQWVSSTQEKLESLKESNYKGPVAIITKWEVDDNQLAYLNRMAIYLDIYLFFSITGMNESQLCSHEDMMRIFKRAAFKYKRIKCVVFCRPIIPGKNDSMDVMRPIINMAREYSFNKSIIFRGYKDVENDFKNVNLNPDFIKQLKQECVKQGVNVYEHTRDIVIETSGNDAIHTVHKMSRVQKEWCLKFLGYDLDGSIGMHDNITLTKAHTHGDVAFIKMLFGLNVLVNNKYDKDKSLLSISFGKYDNIDCTSSWLGWGTNKPCGVGCYYCIAEYSHKEYSYFGTNPMNISEYLVKKYNKTVSRE